MRSNRDLRPRARRSVSRNAYSCGSAIQLALQHLRLPGFASRTDCQSRLCFDGRRNPTRDNEVHLFRAHGRIPAHFLRNTSRAQPRCFGLSKIAQSLLKNADLAPATQTQGFFGIVAATADSDRVWKEWDPGMATES